MLHIYELVHIVSVLSDVVLSFSITLSRLGPRLAVSQLSHMPHEHDSAVLRMLHSGAACAVLD